MTTTFSRCSVCVPMSAQAPQPPLGVTGDEPPSMRLRLRSQSSCPTPVRRDHWRRPRGGALAAAGALVQRRSAWTEWAIHACSARRPSSTGSRFGTGMGAEQRAVRSGGAHPVNRSQLGRRLELDARSRPEIWPCGAPFGHEAERALVRGKLVGFGALQWAVRRHAARVSGTPRQNTGRAQHHDGSTARVSVLNSPPRTATLCGRNTARGRL